MRLLSAYEDFSGRTLSVVSARLEKLAFVCGLLQRDGSYRHWGMTRTHGDAAAQSAMLRAHGEAAAGVLRTPMRELLQEELSGEGIEDLKQAWDQHHEQLAPPAASRAAQLHLSSVLEAFWLVTRNRSSASRRAA